MNDFVSVLAEIADMSEPAIWAGFLVFLRVGAAMALLPAFGEQAVPARVRLVLALAFTAIVAPAVLDMLPATIGPTAILSETLAGLAIGIGLRLFILALQVAGAIAAQATSLAQLFAGAGAEPQPAVGHLLTMAGLAVAVALGLHLRIAELLIESYRALPPGRLPVAGDLADWGLAQVTRAFSLGFSLAMPFVIASFLYNLAMGVINRAMPHLMVSFVGAPALAFGGLVVLALVTPLMLGLWVAALNDFLASPFTVP